MSLRMICTTCNGQGYTVNYWLYKKQCSVCKGTGLFIEQNFRKIRRGKKLNKKT